MGDPPAWGLGEELTMPHNKRKSLLWDEFLGMS